MNRDPIVYAPVIEAHPSFEPNEMHEQREALTALMVNQNDTNYCKRRYILDSYADELTKHTLVSVDAVLNNCTDEDGMVNIFGLAHNPDLRISVIDRLSFVVAGTTAVEQHRRLEGYLKQSYESTQPKYWDQITTDFSKNHDAATRETIASTVYLSLYDLAKEEEKIKLDASSIKKHLEIVVNDSILTPQIIREFNGVRGIQKTIENIKHKDNTKEELVRRNGVASFIKKLFNASRSQN